MATSRLLFCCHTCDERDSINVAGLCKQCKELYCAECLETHKTFKATKNHPIIAIGVDFNTRCDTCFEKGKGNFPAVTLCAECWELYCESCKQRHLKFRATKDHDLINITKSRTEPDQKSTRKWDVTSTQESDMQSTAIPEDSVNLSSDFEGFTVTKENLGAQAPVLSPEERNQQKQQQQHKPQNIKQLNKKAMDNISVKMVTTFNGKIKQDVKDCYFNGIICLKDGRLILLDRDNEKLKMFNRNLQVICTEQTKVPGFGMTKISEDMITVVGGQTLNFYTITSDSFVLQDKVLKLDGYGLGVSYNKGRYAVVYNVFGTKDPLIKICSDSGKEIYRITSFSHKPSNIINLDSVDDCLYVSPYKTSEKFTCLSLQGQLLWEMDFAGRDIVEINKGLLVTDMNNAAIYLCSKAGTYKRKLIQDKGRLNGAKYLAYNSDTQQLFVTCFNNNIMVLQLSY